MTYPAKEEEIDKGAPSASTSNCFSQDLMLRRKGFRIHRRPKHGLAVWERHGQFYSHDDAVAMILQPSEAEQNIEGRADP